MEWHGTCKYTVMNMGISNGRGAMNLAMRAVRKIMEAAGKEQIKV